MREQPNVSLTLFFPAYNEEENIAEAIESSRDALMSSPYIRDWEIIVVDDGSRDRTREVAESIAADCPQVRVISHGENRGYGAALRTGFDSARMDYVFFTDADLQFDITDLLSLLARLGEYDVVVGYRAPRQDPFMRKLNAAVWNVLNRILFGLHIRDIDCAFKVFRRELLQNIELTSKGAMINAELLIRLARQGVSIKEVPVSHLPRVAGSPTGAKPVVILRALREMISLYGGDLGSITQKQAMKFMAVGLINTALDVMAYLLLTRATNALADFPTTAKFLSFFAGTISSFVLNRYWTFGIRTKTSAMEVARFYTSVSVSLIINVAVMYMLTNGLKMYDLVALAMTTVATFAANFTLSKVWVFKTQEHEKKAEPATV
jgi:glycosyltransferase involved in cell wall biosynthesis